MGASQLREIVTEKREGATGIYILTCGFGSFVLFLLFIYFFPRKKEKTQPGGFI